MNRLAVWVCALFLGLLLTANGQQRPQIELGSPEKDGDDKVPIDIFEIEASYVFESDLNHGGSFGKQDEIQNQIYYARRFEIEGRWYARAGLGYSRFDFGNTAAPVPVHLQSAAAVFAVEYMKGDDVGAMLEVRPGFYTEEHIGLNSFDCPITLIRFWILKTDELYLLTGLNYSFLRGGAGVAPVLGLVWVPCKKFHVMLVPSEPRAVYHVSNELDLYLGGAFEGGSFRTDHHDEYKGIPHVEKLSGTQVDFSDYRVGGGIVWTPVKNVDIDLAAGCSIQRAFLYHRAGENYRTDPSPYVRIQIKAAF
ncbi:MAG TPA: hypothetical protein VJ719_10385 [Chthoniobacterales bacterium]|nr:hypothetical protein [Chthoniobacterales bacterium]